MKDPRLDHLAKILIDHSCQLKPDERVLIEAIDLPEPTLACRLVELATDRGAHPFVTCKNNALLRTLYRAGSEVNLGEAGGFEAARMREMDAYIGIRGSANSSQFGDVPQEKMAMTAPVISRGDAGEKMTMSAPVLSRQGGGSDGDAVWTYQFVMEQRYTVDTLPAPIDSEVHLRTIDVRWVAAWRFSGRWTAENVDWNERALLDALEALVLLSVLLDETAGDEILELLVRTEPQHLLPTADSVPLLKVFIHKLKELIELVGFVGGENVH